MQVSKHTGFEKRAQLYAAKAYSRQIIKEDEDHKKWQYMQNFEE
ncbi:hypothetical protein REISMN_02255 [Rickettsia tamurae subsp. buchneri]|uniref:Uncharacterized protein n=2 Tax=spotted fever group TaxID=114277 RepID=A0A8E1C089_9RICK|nr:hypothetical protein REIS_0765 [Rickettsia endosymbiont of Ixodes scapularis]KDO03334.1 hypothetical protein REISMN_02255 [Rickettsia tamurae subsp. buchneri]